MQLSTLLSAIKSLWSVSEGAEYLSSNDIYFRRANSGHNWPYMLIEADVVSTEVCVVGSNLVTYEVICRIYDQTNPTDLTILQTILASILNTRYETPLATRATFLHAIPTRVRNEVTTLEPITDIQVASSSWLMLFEEMR